jgi:endonuclease/exonuclease/phosphatase family metal-dependent hydrolase
LATTFRTATFNLRSDCITDIKNRWRARREIVAQTIERMGVSVVGVQEMLPFMRDDVMAMLNSWRIVGEGRSRRFMNEHSDILVRETDAAVEGCGTFWLSRRPDRAWSRHPLALFPRICTSAEIKLADGKRIRVYNTHLDCISSHARKLGAEVILRYIERAQEEKPLPFIIMGDFNAKPSSTLIGALRGGTFDARVKVRDAAHEYFQRKGLPESGTYHYFKGRAQDSPIDYIFVSEEFTVESAYIERSSYGGRYPSDHFPLVAELSV